MVNSHLLMSEKVFMSIELRFPKVGMMVMVPLGFDNQLSELNC